MDLVQTLILSLIQGITEWLPVSSSGHLNIARNFMSMNVAEPSYIFFDFMLHIGTLCVVLLAFRRDIVKILKAMTRQDFQADEGKMVLFIVVGSIPTAVVGFILNFLFRKQFESLYLNLLAVGVALLINGFFLLVSHLRRNNKSLSYVDSLLMGLAQGVAIVPGISRSGVTISTGLSRKVKKEIVFRYSFLLSIPAVIGATIAESRNLVFSNLDLATVLIGVVTSMIVGYASLKLLYRVVMKEKVHLFAGYCWIVGLIIIAFLLS
ncbi:MAG: undecaprenyl-diphosphate phosphatase [Candidatus Bathyarchaeota archaeon]|nr:MAG: undecaprenyl-diphosphate phosphatase [Candidatus Bathyarchaeota archaeon]